VSQFNVPSSQVTVTSIEPKAWPDTSLGCPEPGQVYAQHVVPGWIVKVEYNGATYEFHTDAMGNQMVTCDPALVGTPLPTVNVAKAAQLQGVTAVVIASASNPGATSSQIRITDPTRVSALVHALDGATSLKTSNHCQTTFTVTFEMPGQSAAFQYGCQGNGSLIRGDESFFHGDDGVAPAAFGTLIGQALASRPFPNFPSS